MNLTELQRLRDEATQGEWKRFPIQSSPDAWESDWVYDEDAEYIVALHNAFPAIAHELTVLRSAMEKVRGMDVKDSYGDEDPADSDYIEGDIRTINLTNRLWRAKRNAIIEEVDRELNQ